jgi:imidazolonepropionase-like amidohydrolase
VNRFAALLLLTLAAGCGPARIGSAPPPRVAILHVTIVDVQSGELRPDHTVLIAGDRIETVGPATRLRVPAGATVVDASGRYLIPGLWDMHAHTGGEPGTRDIHFPRWVAHGVTGIRDMAGDCNEPCGATETRAAQVHQWRHAIAAGTLIGPRIVASGPIVDGPQPLHAGSMAVSSEVEARRAVQQTGERGADFIKVYSLLPRAAYFALADEANRQRIRFAGHVPISVTVEEAARAGQASMEHLYGIAEACSAREAEIREGTAEALSQPGATSGIELAFLVDGALSLALEGFSEEKCAPLLSRLADQRSWQVPTLVEVRARKAMFFSDEAIHNSLVMVGALHRAGVPILAGSDAGDPSEIGSRLHVELSLLVEAGLPPLEALRAATWNAAEYLNLPGYVGAVQRGALADLVLLDANPLEDIGNVRRISAVILNGRYLDRQALDDLLVASRGHLRPGGGLD